MVAYNLGLAHDLVVLDSVAEEVVELVGAVEVGDLVDTEPWDDVHVEECVVEEVVDLYLRQDLDMGASVVLVEDLVHAEVGQLNLVLVDHDCPAHMDLAAEAVG